MRRAKNALDQVEAIDPHARMTLLARASYLLSSGDWSGQFAVSDELIRNFPNDPTSHHHRCSSLLRFGRFRDQDRQSRPSFHPGRLILRQSSERMPGRPTD